MSKHYIILTLAIYHLQCLDNSGERALHRRSLSRDRPCCAERIGVSTRMVVSSLCLAKMRQQAERASLFPSSHRFFELRKDCYKTSLDHTIDLRVAPPTQPTNQPAS